MNYCTNVTQSQENQLIALSFKLHTNLVTIPSLFIIIPVLLVHIIYWYWKSNSVLLLVVIVNYFVFFLVVFKIFFWYFTWSFSMYVWMWVYVFFSTWGIIALFLFWGIMSLNHYEKFSAINLKIQPLFNLLMPVFSFSFSFQVSLWVLALDLIFYFITSVWL